MQLVLFEDEFIEQLFPITVSRPAFAISCGSFRLIDLMTEWHTPFCYIVRPHLRAITATDYPQGQTSPEGSGPMLLVNAAVVPSASAIDRLRDFAEAGKPGLVRTGHRIAAALLPEDQPPEARHLTVETLGRFLGNLQIERMDVELPLLEYPHDVVRHHVDIINENLEHRLRGDQFRQLQDGVFVAEGAQLGQYCVADTSAGPIILDEGARVGPYCYLVGPAYLGPQSRVNEHAAIKDKVSLGHTTKIGGEVEASIIEPYSNKQHHGFLGHSYLGSWINLGAGTCNSDLKNTYGEVNMEYGGRRHATGMQFLGCILGDYAKTAINTSIFTGKVIGACSMLYGSITRNVPSFTNYARSYGQVTEVPVEVAVSTQARMFARRSVTQRPCDVQLLHDMYALTRHERQLGDEPLSL